MKQLPVGIMLAEVRDRLSMFSRNDWKPSEGRLPLHCYFAGEEVARIALDAYAMFAHTNALAPQAFPSCLAMEGEVVAMVLGLLNGAEDGAGSITSGGTESIILALKAARDKARAQQQVVRPNIVISSSTHPAFDKGAQLLGIEVRRVPVGADFRSDVHAMADALDANTVMMVGSAPSLPYGLFDHIAALSDVAQRRGVWLHVDACIGGLLAPFVRAIGYPLPAFDFALPGVRSMSADLHKFGYAAKGASLVLYRDAADHQFQISRFTDWPKGEYVTPTLSGTRSGGAIAAAWAVMRFLGHDGYCDVTRRLMALRARYLAAMADMPALSLLGEPELSVLTLTSKTIDIFALADEMRRRGWYMSMVAQPPAIQQTLNLVHEASADRYLTDLSQSIDVVGRALAAHRQAPAHVVTY